MAHRLRKSTWPTRLGKKARASMRWSLEANLAMLGTVAAIAITLSLLLLVLPTSELHAQANSAPSVSRVSPSSPVSLTTGGSQTFQVSATDADNNLTKWEWEVDKHFSLLHGHQEPEETFTATASITRSFSHTFPDDGAYTVTVTFTDSDGESGAAEWRVEVEDPPNRAPSVSRVSPRATAYVATGDVTFTATATDPDDNLKSYEWFVDDTSEDDGSWLLVLPTGAVTRTFTHNFPDAGAYTVKVTFTDDEGLSASVSWTVTAVEPITVQLGADNYTVNEDENEDGWEAEFTVTISASPPESVSVRIQPWKGTAQGYLGSGDYWFFLDTVVFGADTTTLTQTFPLTVVDDNIVEGTETFTVTLYPLTLSPLPTYVSLTRSEATVKILDDDEAVVRWRWIYNFARERGQYDDLCVIIQDQERIDRPFTVHFSYTDPDGALSSESTIPSSVTFMGREPYKCVTIELGDVASNPDYTSVFFTLDRVTSAGSDVASRVIISNEHSTAELQVYDQDTPPSVTRVSPSPGRVSLEAGDSQTFTARATEDVGNHIVNVAWSVNGQERDSEWLELLTVDITSSFTHTFPDDGTYTVLVTFTDRGGVPGSVSWTVEVGDSTEPANRPPSVSRVSPPQESLSLYTGETHEFIVRATDPDNNLAKWKWEAKHYNSTRPYVGLEEPLGLTGSTTKTFSYKFEKAGAWNVTATFTDFVGETGSVTWTVEATDGPDLAIDELELISLKPASEVGALIPPATVGDSFGVELDYRNHRGPASGAYEVSFYFKVPSWELPIELPGPIWDRFDKPLVEPAFNPGTDIPLRPNLPGPSLGVGERKRTGLDVEVPSGIEAGPYWFCAQIEHKEPIPDPREDDNAICIMMYVVSHPEVAEWVHPVDPWDGRYGRIWLGMLYEYFDPAEVSYFIRVSLVEEGSRKQWYRRVALELAARQALETDDYLNWIDGLRDQIEVTGDDAETLHNILTLYGEAQNITGHAGLSSEVTKSITGVAGPIMSGVNLASVGADVYFGMIVNRGANLDSALATLKVLEDLPIDEDFPEKENEWREGIQLAKQDVHDMLSEDAWKEFSVAAREVSDELVLGSVSFTVSIVAASGLTIKGIALGATAHTIGLYLLPSFLVQAVNTHFDHLVLSFLAAQVYAELYQEDVSGDHLEALTYAKYAAYDHFYESQDGLFVTFAAWVRRHLDTVEKIKEHAAQERDAALEEARSHVQLATIEFNRQHYSLKVGDVVRLEPEFKSGSGKNMIGYGVEWDVTSYDPPDTEVVAIDDTGVVTALRSGEAIIAANIGSVVSGVVVTVTSDYECVNGAVADTTNTGLVADCEALFAARDTLGGESTLTWSEDTPITEWDGVTLGGTPSRVTGLDLDGEGLDGTIPVVLKALAKLERLDLRSNMLTGPIPEGLESLVNLRELRLSGNQLIGCVPAVLRDVAVHDLGDLGIPYCDESLSGLAIDPATSLEPPFDPYHTHYTVVAEGSQVTVTPTNDHGATFEFLDGDYGALADADGSEAGHQVDLTVGVTTVRVRVGGLTYTIIVAYDDPLARYDSDGDNMIDKAEVIEAINDYLFGEGAEPISKAEVIELINLYLFGPS